MAEAKCPRCYELIRIFGERLSVTKADVVEDGENTLSVEDLLNTIQEIDPNIVDKKESADETMSKYPKSILVNQVDWSNLADNRTYVDIGYNVYLQSETPTTLFLKSLAITANYTKIKNLSYPYMLVSLNKRDVYGLVENHSPSHALQ